MKSAFDPNFPIRPRSFPFFYGWWILIASSIGIIASIPGQTMGFSVFTEILSEKLQLNASVLSTSYLVGTIAGGVFLPAVGKLFDEIGARKLGSVVCVVMGIGLLYLSQVDRTTQFLQNLLTFIPASWIGFLIITIGFFWLRFTGQGALTMTSRSMLGKWFNRHRGLAISVSGVVVSFSFSLAPAVLDKLNQISSWRMTWGGLGVAMMTVVLLFVWLFFRDNPEECELRMDGAKEDESVKKEKNKDIIIHREFTRAEALRTHSFWIFNLSIALHSFAITGFTFHILDIARDIGIERSLMLKAFVPSSVIGIVISLIGGVINPFVRLKYILAIFPIGGILFTIGPIWHLESMLWLLIVGLGISGGVFGLLIGLVWPRFFGRKHLGAISGVNMSTNVYASALAPLIFSLCRDLTGHYHLIFVSLLVCYVLVLATCFFADNPQRKLASD